MRERFLSRWLVALCLLAPVAGAAEQADEGWRFLSSYLFRDAKDAFTHDKSGTERQRSLGLAACLLNDPPVTPWKVAEAEARLNSLGKEGPADENALYARFLLARIAHVHRPAEIAEIETAYRAVITAAPAHPLAQLAAGKLALVLLYQRPDLSIAQRISAAAALESVAGVSQLPEAASAYYRLLANAVLFYDSADARALDWLRRAEELGPSDIVTATGLRIQIAETARALGRRDEALAYYRKFLATAVPTDNRYRTAQERMAEFEKEHK